MSPALIAAIHDELDTARRLVDRCMERASTMAIMAAFPGPGDEPGGEVGEPHPAPDLPPARPGWQPARKH